MKFWSWRGRIPEGELDPWYRDYWARVSESSWEAALSRIAEKPDLCLNSCYPLDRSEDTVLHRAAGTGAPEGVVRRLLELGAWRGLRNARGERPVDTAARCGHAHLARLLTPRYRLRVAEGALMKLEEHLHVLVREQLRGAYEPIARGLRLPQLEPLLERPEDWRLDFPHWYGGFNYWFARGGDDPVLAVSWAQRVADITPWMATVTPAGWSHARELPPPGAAAGAQLGGPIPRPLSGAIAGDVIGQPYESFPTKRHDFPLFPEPPRFTDDSVLTVATAHAILTDGDYAGAYRRFGERYPGRGYGNNFSLWINEPALGPYNSWGNGSAMRVSPIGYAFDSAEAVLEEARRSAAVTHDHPEGVKGAQAVALAVFLARSGADKNEIRAEIEDRFGYDLGRKLEEIRPAYSFDVSCQGSVPEALIAFLESNGVEEAIRNAVSLGGDSDTMACIAGEIALAFFREMPGTLWDPVQRALPAEFTEVLARFEERHGR